MNRTHRVTTTSVTRPAWIESIIASRVAEVLEREVLEQIDQEFGSLPTRTD